MCLIHAYSTLAACAFHETWNWIHNDTSWSETFASGSVQLGEAGTSSFGLIQSGGLENSNVDIAEQLVNLITAQRNFQANAQIITTADTVTQTIINLR